MSQAQLSAKFDRQCALEMEGYRLGIERYNMTMNNVHSDPNKDNTTLTPEMALLQKYIGDLSAKIAVTSRRTDKTTRGNVKAAKVFLRQIDPDRLAYLTLQHCLNADPTVNALTSLCVSLGKRIEKDWEYYMFQEKAPGYLTAVERNLKSAHMRHRHNVLNHCARKVELRDPETKEVVGVGIDPLNWNEEMRFAVGKCLMEAATTATPLFEISTLSKRNTSSGGDGYQNVLIMQRTEACRSLLERSHALLAEMKPLVYPGIIPPKPWTGVRGGGFHTQYKSLRTKMIRTRNRKALERAGEHGVERVADALNTIGNTKFRINRKVLEVMTECARTGLGGLPAPDQDRVEVDGHYPLEETCPWTDAEINLAKKTGDPAWTKWNRDRSTAWDIWHRANSARQSLLWQLKIANKFADEPEIYFAWNIDYRGRVYCYQPYLNPQQNDSGRGLLEFADGKPLGNSGVKWLMIHGANEFGYDKATLQERQQWVLDHEDEILDSANNPLDGARFWCEADKPFQFLAFCFEFAGYRREGQTYVSHLPLQVDGTCSGLQHYSALLRDTRGASAVNLTPSGQKADVYAQAAEVSNALLNQDLEKGGDESKFAAAWLGIGVDRKITKRNTMTFCYGATRPGFSQQLIDHVQKEHIVFPEGIDVFKACHYMGDVNWRAISTVLTKSVAAMGFLQKLAFFMGKNQLDIQWTTPIGLRVTQDYLKTTSKRIRTWWGGVEIKPRIQEETDEKNPAGARNGIAPNFIHSLDASHLMLTVQACHAKGINAFSLIHDSFGTHAADMETMSQVLRETFIDMYSDNLLEKFVADVRAQIPAENLADFEAIVSELMPTPGDLDVRMVEKSLYFFS